MTQNSADRKIALVTGASRGVGRAIALELASQGYVVPHYGIVGPSKAALEALIRYLAVELRPLGIIVNCILGGFIETDGFRLLSHQR